MERSLSRSYTNGWSAAMEGYHRHTMQKCQGYAWLHFQAAGFYSKVYLWLMVPATLLNVVLGAGGLASVSTIIGDPLWYLYLAIFALNILVGMLVAVNGLLQPNVTSFEHRQLATDYVHLVRKMESELLLDPGRRVGCDDFRDMIDIEYENLMKNDIPVPSHIVHRFEDAVREDMAKPEMILDHGLRRNLTSVISGAGTPRYGAGWVSSGVPPPPDVPLTQSQSSPVVMATPVRRAVPVSSSQDSPGGQLRASSESRLPSVRSAATEPRSPEARANWASAYVELQRRRRGSASPEPSENTLSARQDGATRGPEVVRAEVSFADEAPSGPASPASSNSNADYAPLPAV